MGKISEDAFQIMKLSSRQQLSLHLEVLSGKRVAIGWGVSGSAPYYINQSPYSYLLIIDGTKSNDIKRLCGIPISGPDRLLDFSAAAAVIVIFADIEKFGDEIEKQVEELGPYPVVCPVIPHEIIAATSTIKAGPDRIFAYCQDLTIDRLVSQLKAQCHYRGAGPVCCLHIDHMYAGGAHTQLVLLARGLVTLGWQVHLITFHKTGEKHRQWEDKLVSSGVNCHALPEQREVWGMPLTREEHEIATKLMCFMRARGTHNVIHTSRLLARIKPSLVVAYLDDPNIVAAVSALICGVPKIIMSGRSLAPSHFYKIKGVENHVVPVEQMSSWYRSLLRSASVSLNNNSHIGACSYEKWIGLPERNVPVVANAFDRNYKNHSKSTLHLKDLSPKNGVIVGVMRFSTEKAPLLFVELVTTLKKHLPSIRALLAGDGPLMPVVKDQIMARGIANHLKLSGEISDIGALCLQADVLVSTSLVEGTPNVILEAQAVGCPVVATNVGATLEALSPVLHAYTAEANDVDMLSRKVLKILSLSAAERTDLAKTIKHYVKMMQNPVDLALNTLKAAGYPFPEGKICKKPEKQLDEGAE